MCMYDGSISDLKWWYNNVKCMESPIRREPHSLEMFTDFSYCSLVIYGLEARGCGLTFLNTRTLTT